MKITVVIETRTDSTRLPGKVLLYAAGAPLGQRMVERVCAARTPTDVVIATTELAIDIAICARQRARPRKPRRDVWRRDWSRGNTALFELQSRNFARRYTPDLLT